MAKFSRIKKDFLEAMRGAGQTKTQAYDTPATVLRTDGDTLWVHIDGGVDETPIKRTIDARPGDVIQVRVGGGRAWATGNATSPPTDDTKAKEADTKAKDANILAKLAKKTADKAGKTATNYLSWSAEYGLIVSEDATEDPEEMEGGSVRLDSNGLKVFKGQAKVADFGQDVELIAPNGSKFKISATTIGMYWSGGIKVFEVDTSQNGGGVYHLNDGIIYDEGAIFIDQTGGASDALIKPYLVKYDKVVQLRLDISSDISIASGSNIFEGEFASSNWNPKLYVAGVGYYGGHAIVGRINPNGKIIIRNASASAVTVSDTVSVTFTYILAN